MAGVGFSGGGEPAEALGRVGWRHSSVSDAVAYSQAVGARRIVLFHHDREHSDDELFMLQARAKSSGPQAVPLS